MRRILITGVVVVGLAGCSVPPALDATVDEPSPPPSVSETEAPEVEVSLADEVQAAFEETYGWADDPIFNRITGFEDKTVRVGVITDLAYKDENRADAEKICAAVVSLTIDRSWKGAYVTAGEGGGFLAECDVP